MAQIVIDIDDDLLRRAQDIVGMGTAQETVRYALEELVRAARRSVMELRGAVSWDGDLDDSRVT